MTKYHDEKRKQVAKNEKMLVEIKEVAGYRKFYRFYTKSCRQRVDSAAMQWIEYLIYLINLIDSPFHPLNN